MKSYWAGRIINIVLRIFTLTKYNYIYSQCHCLNCINHLSRTHGKLVSNKHGFRAKHEWHKVTSYGLRKPDKKNRCYTYPIRIDIDPSAIPAKVDLRTYLTNAKYVVRDQGSQGACTGMTTAEDQDLKEIMAGVWKGQTSAAMAYYEIRKLHGWQNEDSGGYMIDEGIVLGSTGICLNPLMPYNDGDYTTAPSSVAYSDAKGHKHQKTQYPVKVSEIKAVIAQYNCGVRIGIPIPQSFYGAQFGGWVPLKYDSILGYHSLLCVGYDDNLKNSITGVVGHFIVLNSWGSMFGDKGYIYIPYAWMQHYESTGDLDNYVQPKLDVVIPACVEGTIEVLTTCPDGITWNTRRVCKSGGWVNESQTCPTTPLPTQVAVRLQISSDGGVTWKIVWSWNSKTEVF